MTCLAPCLLALTVLSAPLVAADPLPAAFIPANAELALQVPDLARSANRWARTPYPRLLETAWGRTLTGEWGGRLDRAAPGALAALATLQAVAVAAHGPADATPQIVVAASGGAQLPAFLKAIWRAQLPGRLSVHGQVVAWASGAVQPGAVPPAPAAEADAGIRLAGGRWLPAAAGELRVDLQLDAVGLRETATLAATEASRLAAVAARVWADPQELRRLPLATLWAATWQGDPALAAVLPGPDAAVLEQFEGMLAANGLPGWGETVAACSGPATLWMAEGVPFPTLGLAISMREEPARRWIAVAAAKLNLAAQTDGAAGFVGLLPLAIGWVKEGRLVITSDPQGVAAWTAAKPGFAEHRGVGEVLAAMPSRTLLLGAGRGGASWAALAQLVVPMLTGMGAPQSVSLPGDLRVAADRGWLYLRLLEDGTLGSSAGGLFGGPLTCASAAAIAVPATMWLQGELQRERREKRAPEAAPQAPLVAPVF